MCVSALVMLLEVQMSWIMILTLYHSVPLYTLEACMDALLKFYSIHLSQIHLSLSNRVPDTFIFVKQSVVMHTCILNKSQWFSIKPGQFTDKNRNVLFHALSYKLQHASTYLWPVSDNMLMNGKGIITCKKLVPHAQSWELHLQMCTQTVL